MNIYAYMVTRNEAGRYLEKAIRNLLSQVDALFVYDDRSDDETVEILKEFRVPYLINSYESFVQNESRFRQNAWRSMEDAFQPEHGDWILTLDADEILRGSSSQLVDLALWGESRNLHGVIFPVREMWTSDQMRVDGFWGTITAARLAQYEPNGNFKQRTMGGGSLPSYVVRTQQTDRVDILHYGYLRVEDRASKYKRYSQHPGHNPRHINSILKTPILDSLPVLV